MTTVSMNGSILGKSFHAETLFRYQIKINIELHTSASNTAASDPFIVEIINLQADFIVPLSRELLELEHIINTLVLAELPLSSLLILLESAATMKSLRIQNIDMRKMTLSAHQLPAAFEAIYTLSQLKFAKDQVAIQLPDEWITPFNTFCQKAEKAKEEKSVVSNLIALNLIQSKKAPSSGTEMDYQYVSSVKPQ